MSKKTMKDYVKDVTPLNIKNATITFHKEKAIYRNNRPIFTTNVNQLLSYPLHDKGCRGKSNTLSVLNRKSKRKFVFEKIIDLHGLTLLGALERLMALFAKFQSENIKNVLVITGGSSIRQSKIRMAFTQWIRNELSCYISAYSQAKPEHGGEGAFYVILRKN